MKPAEVQELLPYLDEAERAELEALLDADLRTVLWRPLPGPQTMASESTADVIGFGGAAGGGKTDLACGKALTQHRVVQFFRRVGTELGAIIDRFQEICGERAVGRPPVLRDIGNLKVCEFGSVPNPGDETGYQGRAKDLLVIDEAANFLEYTVRFLMAWVRSTNPECKPQTLLTFNPPTTAEGRWLIAFFAPWLDKKHPNPAKPGELRYVAVIDGRDVWLPDGDSRQFVLVDGKRVYDFDASKFKPTEIITPQSRTFIPSKITDNPFLLRTGYMTQLQALPEPLRSQMLNGDFNAGMEDDEFQVIPTAWVDAAMARWKPMDVKPPMDAVGVDVARGGNDETVIARRHDNWYDELLCHPGTATPDGPTVAGLVVAATRDGAPQHVDVIGVGASAYDFLIEANQDTYGVNVAEDTATTDKSGLLTMFNLRTALWWGMREDLDPANNRGVALPPDTKLAADLCAPRWKLQGRQIRVESRDEIVKRIGRSPDRASAVLLARIDVPKRKLIKQLMAGQGEHRGEYDPLQNVHGAQSKRYGDYDPTASNR